MPVLNKRNVNFYHNDKSDKLSTKPVQMVGLGERRLHCLASKWCRPSYANDHQHHYYL